MDYFDNEKIKDYGNTPIVTELNYFTLKNKNYRTALWTGTHLQVTVMSIKQNEDVGKEIHENLDQMLYVVSGRAAVFMGKSEDDLSVKAYADGGDAIFIPAGTYHNVINAGLFPLKMFSVYAPVQHPYGTVQENKPTEE